jgi:hypothetical protein
VKQLPQSPPTPSSVSSIAGADDPQLHWQWRQMRKANLVASDSVKDSCPYSRIDSGGSGAKSLQALVRRNDLSPPANLQGSGASIHNGEQYLPRESAEKVYENRRDWQLTQDKFRNAILDDSRGNTSARSLLSKSASDKCFSGSTVSSATNPVHSIRARPVGGGGRTKPQPRWK